jgi:hypothetical protein
MWRRLLFFGLLSVRCASVQDKTYYDVLGCQNGASLKEIKHAYRRQAL